MADRFDVFLSYSRRDAGEWTRVLAENLERLGIHVWWDGWEVLPGDVLVHELDRGLQDSLNGIVVVSPAALESPWVQLEYAALMQRAILGEARFRQLVEQEVGEATPRVLDRMARFEAARAASSSPTPPAPPPPAPP